MKMKMLLFFVAYFLCFPIPRFQMNTENSKLLPLLQARSTLFYPTCPLEIRALNTNLNDTLAKHVR